MLPAETADDDGVGVPPTKEGDGLNDPATMAGDEEGAMAVVVGVPPPATAGDVEDVGVPPAATEEGVGVTDADGDGVGAAGDDDGVVAMTGPCTAMPAPPGLITARPLEDRADTARNVHSCHDPGAVGVVITALRDESSTQLPLLLLSAELQAGDDTGRNASKSPMPATPPSWTVTLVPGGAVLFVRSACSCVSAAAAAAGTLSVTPEKFVNSRSGNR